jgi:putative transposase
MIYPLVTDLAADGVPVAVTCRVLKFSKQGYYRWRANPVTERDWEDAHLVNAALDIHANDPAFGHRFIADELPEKGVSAGVSAGENRVQRLCRDHGIWAVFSKKRA